MFEYVNTSVPNGLLPGTHGFCGVAMTRDLPEPVRRRLESFSSYTHLATANGSDYLRLNPVSWSHFVLDGGEHVLGCVRAAPFDYTGRTNRLARFWFFQPAEFPNGLNPADAILQNGNAESLSDAWSGDPRWLDPRSASPLSSVATRADVRPAAWMQTFGESEGPRLAAAFSVLLAERIRAKGRPLVFLADPATHGDGALLLSLFADLVALLPAPLRAKATFSTYPVALSTATACYLRGEFGDGTRLLAGETAWIDLRARRVHGAETAVVPPELLFLATHGHEQPPEPIIRGGGARRTAPLARPEPAISESTPNAPRTTGRLGKAQPPVGRLISRTTVPRKKKKLGFEDYLIWGLLGALVIGVGLLVSVFFVSPEPVPVPETVQQNETKPEVPKAQKPKPAPKTKEEKPPVVGPTAPTNAPVVKAGPKPVPKPEPMQPKPEEDNPLLFAKTIKIANAFDAKKVKKPEDWVWVYYEPNANSVSFRTVETTKLGFKGDPKTFDFVLLLLDKTSGMLHWRWSPSPSACYFKTINSIDLRQICFGPNQRIFNAWLSCGKTESYSIESDWDLIGSFEIEEQHLTMDHLAEMIRMKLDDAKKRTAEQSADLGPAQKRLDDILKEIDALQQQYDSAKAERNRLDSQIAALNQKVRDANSGGHKTDKEKYEDQRREKVNERNNLPDLTTLGNQLAKKRADKNNAEINVKHARSAVEHLEQLEKLLKDDNLLRSKIRETSFSISVSGEPGT